MNTVTIREREMDDDRRWEVDAADGWFCVTCQTAVEALALVKARDLTESVKTGRNVVTVIVWSTFSGVGRAVVQAITRD